MTLTDREAMPIIWMVGTGDLCTLLVVNYRESYRYLLEVCPTK